MQSRVKIASELLSGVCVVFVYSLPNAHFSTLHAQYIILKCQIAYAYNTRTTPPASEKIKTHNELYCKFSAALRSIIRKEKRGERSRVQHPKPKHH